MQNAKKIFNEDDYELFDINTWLTGGEPDCIAYRVTGSGLPEAGIFSGDIVIANPHRAPKPGELGVSRVSGKNQPFVAGNNSGLRLVSLNGKKIKNSESVSGSLGAIIGVVRAINI